MEIDQDYLRTGTAMALARFMSISSDFLLDLVLLCFP